MNKVIERIKGFGIIPYAQTPSTDNALKIARALCAGILPLICLNYKPNDTVHAIACIKSKIPNCLVGVTSIENIEQLKELNKVGLDFAVVSFYNQELNEFINSNADTALFVDLNNNNLNTLDLTEIETNGLGISTSAKCYSELKDNMAKNQFVIINNDFDGVKSTEYLKNNNVIACFDNSIFANIDLSAEIDDITPITKKVKSAIFNLLGFEFAHMGINCANKSEINSIATFIELLFGFPVKAIREDVLFLTDKIELNYGITNRGQNGHISISTYSVKLAISFLSRLGIQFDYENCLKDSHGNIQLIFITNEIGGFAFHITQKN